MWVWYFHSNQLTRSIDVKNITKNCLEFIHKLFAWQLLIGHRPMKRFVMTFFAQANNRSKLSVFYTIYLCFCF